MSSTELKFVNYTVNCRIGNEMRVLRTNRALIIIIMIIIIIIILFDQYYNCTHIYIDKNTNSCPKTCNKTVTGYIFYHTSKILQTRKLEKSVFLMLFLKHLKHPSFAVANQCEV